MVTVTATDDRPEPSSAGGSGRARVVDARQDVGVAAAYKRGMSPLARPIESHGTTVDDLRRLRVRGSGGLSRRRQERRRRSDACADTDFDAVLTSVDPQGIISAWPIPLADHLAPLTQIIRIELREQLFL